MSAINQNEMLNLVLKLNTYGIEFTMCSFFDGIQIKDVNGEWDVICHNGSYGHEKGMLELMMNGMEDVEGWLSADEAFDLITKSHGDNFLSMGFENGEEIFKLI